MQSYTRFLQAIVTKRNLTRHGRWAEEQAALRPLPATQLALCREVRVPVSRFSTIQVLRNTYSVPARLIGTTVLVRIRSETLEVYRGTAHLLTHAAAARPRSAPHRLPPRHLVAGAQAGRLCPVPLSGRPVPVAELPPGLRCACAPADPRAPTATTCGCSTWPRAPPRTRSPSPSSCCWTSGWLPTFDAVRDLVREPVTARLPVLGPVVLDLGVYDRLLATTHG